MADTAMQIVLQEIQAARQDEASLATLLASLRRNERTIQMAGPAAAAIISASLNPQHTAANIFLL
jgi:hypothetical protein